MIYPPDLQEYLRLRQLFQLSNEQLNYHPETSDTHPAFAVGQPPVHFTESSLQDLSATYASEPLDPDWAIHTTIGHPTVDNSYQSNKLSATAEQHRITEYGIQVQFSPDRTTIPFQSSTSSLRAQEASPPNDHSAEVADMEATSAYRQPQKQDALDQPFECLWDGCKSRKTRQRETFSSLASLMRHIRVQHVAHRSVTCPECGQRFGRPDNMKEHLGRRHRKFD